ncbi:YaiI/YqxD family protein [Ruminococcus sp.]|uniref:YaiI/YqxD family protein n=1 Tax=Ruminococcus sp. TaxID=41978 RepID=UPI0025DC789B|nr:YaiI/YqxD family protein [Ruminococcus sp.]MCI6615731.1 YaiI/YqxD family protein [Ruminococcus sp.]
MKILVDADACPVVKQVEKVAKRYNIPTVLLCDTSHIMNTTYSEVKIIGSGADAVDFALVNMCQKGDIAVTQDYGVAAMVLSKGGYCIHQSGKIFTDDNIGGLLMDRHLAKKARMSKSKNHLKGAKKRTQADDERFEASFESLIKRILNN